MIINQRKKLTNISQLNNDAGYIDNNTIIPIEQGGTGATNAETARTALGAAAESHVQSANTITGGTFNGIVYANDNTSYETYQLRNCAILSAVPSSMTNGQIAFVYS